MYVLVAQSCPTLYDPMDFSLPGSSVHGILQARILEWVAFPSPGDLPDPGIKLGSPAGRVFMVRVTREAPGGHLLIMKWKVLKETHIKWCY